MDWIFVTNVNGMGKCEGDIGLSLENKISHTNPNVLVCNECVWCWLSEFVANNSCAT